MNPAGTTPDFSGSYQSYGNAHLKEESVMKSGTRQRILGMLLGALLLGAAWRFLPSGGDPEKPAARSSGTGVRGAHPEIQVASLHLASLDATRPLSAAGRDPWRFQDPPLRKSSPPKDERIAVSPSRQPSVQPQPAATLPTLALEYLGSFGPREKRIAVLSDGKRTFNALAGDVIDGRFAVERIGYESVEIRRVGMTGSAERLGLRRH